MGAPDTPVRRILNYASEHFTKNICPSFMFRRRGGTPPDDAPAVVPRPVVSDDVSGFDKAAMLSLQVNFRDARRAAQESGGLT